MSAARTGPAGFINSLEETLIALLLGLMTIITFANVVARFVFNSNILWALELTVFLFAWLVLLGASYAVKTHAHLGVDAIVNTLAAPARRVLGLIAVGASISRGFGLPFWVIGTYRQGGFTHRPVVGLHGVAAPFTAWRSGGTARHSARRCPHAHFSSRARACAASSSTHACGQRRRSSGAAQATFGRR